MRSLRGVIGCFLVALSGCSGVGWYEQLQLAEQYGQGPLYTCCNLRPSNGELSDANWYDSASLLGTPSGALPFGAPVTVVHVDRQSFTIRTDEYGELTAYHTYGVEDLGTYMQRILVRDDPKEMALGFPQEIQDAIFEARVMQGMTKQQVLMAIGYPPTHQTPGIASNEWTYWKNRWQTYKLEFDREGRVTRMLGRLPAAFERGGAAAAGD